MSDSLVEAYIGLGSNLHDPVAQVLSGIEDIKNLPETRISGQSCLYRNPPMGPQNQPAYVNAAVRIETTLSAMQLLRRTQEIENKHGRVRGSQRWSSRTLDLDILLFGEACIHTAELEIPHPGLYDRPFVLYPLADIEPQLLIPGGKSLQQLLSHCSGDGLEKILV